MEEPLLQESGKEVTRSRRVGGGAGGARCGKAHVEELMRVIGIALPMIVAAGGQYLLRVSPIFMIGHLGKLQLSGVSIATSFSNVTGFGVLFGMSGALETLCGQAFGAEQYQRLGHYTYGSIICQFITCIPICVLWIFTDKLLILTGQDPAIAGEAGKYLILLIPALFAFASLQSLVRFMMTQSLIIPMLYTTLVSICIQLSVCWALVFKFNLGTNGAAFSVAISYGLNAILLWLYVKYSSSCTKTWVPFSIEALRTMGEFFRFAIPSAAMNCLEIWAFELVILLSGRSTNPQLEASVLSICLTITSVHFHIPYSFGAAASTRISNELGAGNPQAARLVLSTVLLVSVSELMLASLTLFLCRSVLGYAFSGEKDVISYIKDMVPLLCMSYMVDGTVGVLSGVARGSGWQDIGAYVNLGSYYLVGVPISLILGFALHLRGMGLWGGLVAGTTVQALSLSIVTSLTNWEKKAMEARSRMSEGLKEEPTSA